jgi:inward rectifier potassium channel
MNSEKNDGDEHLTGIPAEATEPCLDASQYRRLMNRNGSFNITRAAAPFDSVSYLRLLTITWGRFFALIALLHIASNVFFASAYYLCGPGALATNGPRAEVGHLWSCFFFSIQTLSTIGYGGAVPISLAANLIVSIEAIYGVLVYSLITGLFFARISRTRARLRFTDTAAIFHEGAFRYLQIRVANRSCSEIIDLSAKLIYSRNEQENGTLRRRTTPLTILRPAIAFLPLAWNIRHCIDTQSPLFDVDLSDFAMRAPELMLLVVGMDESSGQAVSGRTSYVASEVLFSKRHTEVVIRDTLNNIIGIDYAQFDAVHDG